MRTYPGSGVAGRTTGRSPDTGWRTTRRGTWFWCCTCKQHLNTGRPSISLLFFYEYYHHHHHYPQKIYHYCNYFHFCYNHYTHKKSYSLKKKKVIIIICIHILFLLLILLSLFILLLLLLLFYYVYLFTQEDWAGLHDHVPDRPYAKAAPVGCQLATMAL